MIGHAVASRLPQRRHLRIHIWKRVVYSPTISLLGSVGVAMAAPDILTETIPMIATITSPLVHLHQYPAHSDEPALTRNKRSYDQTFAAGPANDFNRLSANDRRKSTGTLDSLGRGHLL